MKRPGCETTCYHFAWLSLCLYLVYVFISGRCAPVFPWRPWSRGFHQPIQQKTRNHGQFYSQGHTKVIMKSRSCLGYNDLNIILRLRWFQGPIKVIMIARSYLSYNDFKVIRLVTVFSTFWIMKCNKLLTIFPYLQYCSIMLGTFVLHVVFSSVCFCVFQHMFREPEKRPAALVSTVFTGLVLLPFAVLFIAVSSAIDCVQIQLINLI